MGVVCQACGAENLGGVSVCRLCAAPLLAPAAAADAQRRSGGAERSGRSVPWWVLVLGLGALLLAGLWLGGQTEDPEPASGPEGSTRAAPVRAADGVGEPADEVRPNGDSLAQATAAAEARLQASLERLAREDRERREALARERLAREAGIQPTEAVRRAERTGEPGRARVAQPAPAISAQPTPVVAPEPVGVPPENPTPVAEAPTPARTVEQRCADGGNFLARTACQVRLCRDPALARDPACVRLRELEQANRPDPLLLN
ncbi:MAG TPA: hypothetical protein PKC60_07515 [Hydrogenophaga sp.]|uniref:hypothetical protein n=1 Tax=Hydrogenophaga sp. TaxID=1904254 RepID=UPI002B957C48|nr:hypothetical protein [Hydrogenophaga sp.]HMN93063.1 hypothetical protein [Hydrogenophaga sp.]HMP09806.1 hypothetical protein [Hydrogenophaga sp.]